MGAQAAPLLQGEGYGLSDTCLSYGPESRGLRHTTTKKGPTNQLSIMLINNKNTLHETAQARLSGSPCSRVVFVLTMEACAPGSTATPT